MPISQETIKYIAHLARLNIENTRDGDSIQADLNRIVAMVDQITATNTKGVDPIAHSLEAAERLRTDVVTETDQRDSLLALAPKAEAGLFLVPIVLE